MRFGVCTGIENVGLLQAGGWDYVEPTVAGTLQPERPEAEVMPALEAEVGASGLRAETYNVLLPGDLKVVGPAIEQDRQNRYLDQAFGRAVRLGGKVVVFGSGGARHIPPGFDPAAAHRQVLDFVRRAGAAAAAHGLLLAIEPLNRSECNHIVSVVEATALAREVAQPAVAVLSDLYHISEDHQSYEETRQAGSLLRHVHVAGQQGRRAPVKADHEFLTEYFRVLKAMGYDERISVEGRWENLDTQLSEALDTLQAAWAVA